MRCSSQVLLLACCVAAVATTASAAWCGSEGCYEVLGLKESADAKAIRVSYYKLSRQLHPDKNKNPDAPKKFQRVAKAYEVLSDERSRKRYDYALAHPEEDIQEEPYGIWKYWRTDARAVILGFLAVISAIQYFGKLSAYDSALKKVMATPRFANRRAQLAAEWEARNKVNGGSSLAISKGSAAKLTRRSKAKAGSGLPPHVEKEIEEQALSEVSIHGSYGRPTVRDTLAYQIVIAPWWLAKWVYWQAHWVWAYQWQKQDYTPEDRAFLTYKALKWTQPIWEGLPEAERDELAALGLWERDAMVAFGREVKQGRRRLPKMVSLQSEGVDDPWAAVGDE
jgi:curved DNA-binding protein CbpA